MITRRMSHDNQAPLLHLHLEISSLLQGNSKVWSEARESFSVKHFTNQEMQPSKQKYTLKEEGFQLRVT